MFVIVVLAVSNCQAKQTDQVMVSTCVKYILYSKCGSNIEMPKLASSDQRIFGAGCPEFDM